MKFSRSSAFTLIEVLVASVILAFSLFGVLALLRAGDTMTYVAKADGQIAQKAKDRVGYFVSVPYSRLKALAIASDSAAFEFDFMWGVEDGLNGTDGFPFQTRVDAYHGAFDAEQFFMDAPPLPGDTASRNIFPYYELATLDFYNYAGVACTPSESYYVEIGYTLFWRDTFKDTPQTFSFGPFRRYDPSY